MEGLTLEKFENPSLILPKKISGIVMSSTNGRQSTDTNFLCPRINSFLLKRILHVKNLEKTTRIQFFMWRLYLCWLSLTTSPPIPMELMNGYDTSTSLEPALIDPITSARADRNRPTLTQGDSAATAASRTDNFPSTNMYYVRTTNEWHLNISRYTRYSEKKKFPRETEGLTLVEIKKKKIHC